MLKEFIFCHENVPSFPVSILRDFFGEHYNIWSAIVSPVELGLPFKRTRRLTLLVRKSFGGLSTEWNEMNIKAIFGAPLGQLKFSDFMLASRDELQRSIDWAKSRPGHADEDKTKHNHGGTCS